MSRLTTPPRPTIKETAAAFRAAYEAGYRHGLGGGDRSKDPFVDRDPDLHLCWDTGWVSGADERDRRVAK